MAQVAAAGAHQVVAGSAVYGSKDRAKAIRAIRTACEAVAILKQQPVAAVELMDRASLRSVEGMPGIPDDFADLSETAAALLIETRAADANGLARNIATVRDTIAGVETVYAPAFTDKVQEYTKLWNVRKGLFPAVGSARSWIAVTR